MTTRDRWLSEEAGVAAAVVRSSVVLTVPPSRLPDAFGGSLTGRAPPTRLGSRPRYSGEGAEPGSPFQSLPAVSALVDALSVCSLTASTISSSETPSPAAWVLGSLIAVFLSSPMGRELP